MDMECERYSRCNTCLKKNYKLRAKQYQDYRRWLFETSDRFGTERGALIIPEHHIKTLMSFRLAVGKAYRRWKRGQRNSLTPA